MGTSLAAQLQAIASNQPHADEPKRRPFTRPSILFDPREAADVDLETLHTLALAGLDELARMDNRFAAYKRTLFSFESLQTDRELENREFNAKLDKSLGIFLRLLSGYLLLSHSHKALEYLIRRYKIYAYNVDDVMLCALPYHETSLFVRIVQLLKLKKTKWHFLGGVKSSGAPPTRAVLVQQCTRDMAVLEAICEYNMPVVKNRSNCGLLLSFCVAILVETLGAVTTVNGDILNRVLPFVFRCLDPIVGHDYQVGGLIVVGMLAGRATMLEKLVQKLICSIARMIRRDVKELDNISCLQMSLMAMIKLTQTQSIKHFPWNALEALVDVSDFPAILLELSKTFNIAKFLSLILDGLIHHSLSHKSCQNAFISIIAAVPVKDHIGPVVSKVLQHCMGHLVTTSNTEKMQHESLEGTGNWTRQILLEIEKHYPAELDKAVCNFLENSHGTTTQSKSSSSVLETLWTVFSGTLHVPMEESNASIYLSLEHPKAQIRAAAVSSLTIFGIVEAANGDLKAKLYLQETLLRRLHDDDLSVVRAVLSLDGLAKIIDPIPLFEALSDILSRCCMILRTGLRGSKGQAYGVADFCLEFIVSSFLEQHPDYSKEVATMIFPYILILPKTWKLNKKALHLAGKISWPFFNQLSNAEDLAANSQTEKMEESWQISMNNKIIRALSDALLKNPGTCLPWLIECSRDFKRTKPLLYLILIRSFMEQTKGDFWHLIQGCLPFLKQEWSDMDGGATFVQTKPESIEALFSQPDIYQQIDSETQAVNGKLLIAVFRSLLKNFPTEDPEESKDEMRDYSSVFEDLFVLFSMSPSRNIFKEHIHLLVTHSRLNAVTFLSKFFMAEGSAVPVSVQVESLNALSALCFALSARESSEKNGMQGINSIHLQLALPCILVPLSSAIQAVRRAATECIHALSTLWHSMAISSQKNGISSPGMEPVYERYIAIDTFGEFMESILSLKKLFDSDGDFLAAFLSSTLNSSGRHISAPDNLDKRFDESTKEAILLFILRNALEFPTYAKCIILSVLQGAGNISKQVAETKTLLSGLLLRWKGFHLGSDASQSKLSHDEVRLLCVLLKTYMLHTNSSPNSGKQTDKVDLEPMFEVLSLEAVSPDDPVGIKPCMVVLESLCSTLYDSLDVTVQDQIFCRLIFLITSDIGDIHSAAIDALRRIDVNGTTVSRHLDLVLADDEGNKKLSKMIKKRKLDKCNQEWLCSVILLKEGKLLSFVSALLEFLVWKKELTNRVAVTEPLFKLLGKIVKEDWPLRLSDPGQQGVGSLDSAHVSRGGTVFYVQQLVMTVLESISSSLLLESDLKLDLCKIFDVDLVVTCVNIAKDSTTRNYALSLLTALAKLFPDRVLDHVIDIFTVIGESTITQDDSHSQKVSEELISAIVPCWLVTAKDPRKLLQVFIKALPHMSQHHRLDIVKHLLRTLGEETSLPVLLLLLLQTKLLHCRTSTSSQKAKVMHGARETHVDTEWEYEFVAQLSGQYPSRMWLRSLVKLLQEAQTDACILEQEIVVPGLTEGDSFSWILQIEATHFVTNYLENPELAFQLETGRDQAALQEALGALMEQVVLQLQTLDKKREQSVVLSGIKKDARESTYSLLNAVTKLMAPSAYSKGITLLLKHSDANVQQKALQLLSENFKDDIGFEQQPRKKRKMAILSNAPGHYLGVEGDESCKEMILEIVGLLDGPFEESSLTTKLVAVSTLGVLAHKLSGKFPTVFTLCLSSVVANLKSNNVALSSGCLHCAASLVNELGPQALAELPHIIEYLLQKAQNVCSYSYKAGTEYKTDHEGNLGARGAFLFSLLVALEAIVNKLGGFLSPYLEEVVSLLVLHPEFTCASDVMVHTKAATIRLIISEKIPVRLLLDPLLRIYGKAVETGESSVSAIFEMLAIVTTKMDRPSVAAYHAKIFESCLVALDLRRQHPKSIKNVVKVEIHIINALVALIMKLSEATFKPLFVRALEWAESEVDDAGSMAGRNIQRNISFYSLIDSLTEKLRSVFVPYFQYLMDGCIYHLTRGQDQEGNIQARHKKKKSKPIEKAIDKDIKRGLTESEWHLRMVVISSLHKCFLYDTVGFLDSSKFQVFLKPIVSQLAVDPPNSVDQLDDIPRIHEVDNLLVSCLGQMALTAGTDLLWKPLNHEVLMHTRSEKVRTRMLGLRVVKYLLEHLKEEYLVLLPETIPFLGELLEDSELEVVSQAQEILKSMEDLSGESLSQYL